MRRLLSRSVLLVAAVAWTACGSDVASATPCVEGTSLSCSCPDGREGAQLCQPDGQSYEKCACRGPVPSGATSGTETSASAGGTNGSGGAGHGTSTGPGGGGAGGAGHGASTGPGGGAGGASTGSGGPAPDATWAKAYGDASGAEIDGIAVDDAGDVYLGGTFRDQIRFDATTHTCPASHECAFIAKLDASGARLWSVAPGDANQVLVAVMPDGGVVSTGYGFTLDFGGGPIAQGIFTARHDANGVLMWAYGYEDAGEGTPYVSGVAVDTNGDFTLVAAVNSLDFGLGSAHDATLVARFDDAGTVRWNTAFSRFRRATGRGARAVDIAQDGDVVVQGQAQLDGHVCGAAVADGESVLARLAKDDGACVRSRIYGHAAATIAVDADDSVVLAGSYSGTLDVGSAVLPAPPPATMFVMRVGEDFAPVWGRAFTGSSQSDLSGLTLSAVDGDIALDGDFNGTTDFGSGPLVGGANRSLFVARFAVDGAPRWSGRCGDTHHAYGGSAAFAPDGSLFVSGNFGGVLDFGTPVVHATGDDDAFVVKFPPTP